MGEAYPAFLLESRFSAQQVEHYVTVYKSIGEAEPEIQAWCVDDRLPKASGEVET